MSLLEWNKVSKIFGIIVVVLFFTLGITMIFSKYFLYIPFNMRVIFAFLIVSYGAFRLAIIFNKSRDDEE
jgi:hypothetical protein